MKVILTQKVPNLGQEYDVVNVKPGYARNFLLPKSLATIATPAQIKRAEKVKAERVKQLEEIIKNAGKIADQLKGVTLKFKKKTKGEKLYGSIAEKDIIEALKKVQKVEISKEMIKMKEHFKTVGDHKVKIHLAEKVDAEIKVVIEAE